MLIKVIILKKLSTLCTPGKSSPLSVFQFTQREDAKERTLIIYLRDLTTTAWMREKVRHELYGEMGNEMTIGMDRTI